MTTSTQPAGAAPAPTQAGARPATGAGETCRLTICGPASRVELAVPAHVPLADLMPALLGHLDPALATTGLGHDGWVLQRLGEPALDEDLGTSALGLYDGDVLHLRPRDDQLPLVDFDDLVDGVHTGLSSRQDTWRPQHTRRLLLALVTATALVAVGTALTIGVGTQVALTAGVLALVLLGAGAAASRGFGDTTAGLLLAGAGVGFATVAGLAAPAPARAPLDDPGVLTAPSLLAAGVCAAVAAAAARFAVGVDSVLTAIAGAAALGALGGLLSITMDMGASAAAAVVLTVALLLTRSAPLLSARLAGIAVEPVPTTQAEFQQGIDPIPSASVLARAARADALLTSALGALGVVAAGCLAVLAMSPGWAPATLAAVGALTLALQSRELSATRHRLAALVPPLLAGLALLLSWTAGSGPGTRLGVVLGSVLVAGALLAAAGTLPGRRLVPRWGRWGDLLHWLVALSVVPIALAVLGVYGWIRNGWG